MKIIKTYDPEIMMHPDNLEIIAPESLPDPESFVTEVVLADGSWLDQINDFPNATWGVARYDNTWYLWSGPYDPDMGTATYQVDTFELKR